MLADVIRDQSNHLIRESQQTDNGERPAKAATIELL